MLKSAFIALVIKMTGIYVASFNSAHVVQTFMKEIYGIDLSPNQILTPDRNISYRHKARSISDIYQSYFERTGGKTPRIIFFDDDKNNINQVQAMGNINTKIAIQAIHVPGCGLTPDFFREHLAKSLAFFREQGNEEGDVILVFDFDCTLTKWHVQNLQKLGKQRDDVEAEHSEMVQVLKRIVTGRHRLDKKPNPVRRLMKSFKKRPRNTGVPQQNTRHPPRVPQQNTRHPPRVPQQNTRPPAVLPWYWYHYQTYGPIQLPVGASPLQGIPHQI